MKIDDRNAMQRLMPVGNDYAGMELHWRCTIDLIDKWCIQDTLERNIDSRHDDVKHLTVAMDVLNRFYRNAFSRTDPTWGAYEEFFRIWPDRLPYRGGISLMDLLSKVCASVVKRLPKAK